MVVAQEENNGKDGQESGELAIQIVIQTQCTARSGQAKATQWKIFLMIFCQQLYVARLIILTICFSILYKVGEL